MQLAPNHFGFFLPPGLGFGLAGPVSGMGWSPEEWFWATSGYATFGFAFVNGRVGICAPIGRKWLMGKTKSEARVELRKRRYRVVAL